MALLSERFALRDVADVEQLAARVVRDQLAFFGAYLRDCDRDVAISYLIAEAWLLERRYDPERGLAFSTYARMMLRLRFTDWMRLHFRDTRYNPDLDIFSLEQLAEWTWTQWRLNPTADQTLALTPEPDPRETAAYVLGLLDEDEPDRIAARIDLEHRIRRMPRDHQRALRALQAGLSLGETAELLGESRKTLQRRRRRIEQRLWPQKPPWAWRLDQRRR